MIGEIRDTEDLLRVIDGRLMYCEFDAVSSTDRYGNVSNSWHMVRATPVRQLWLNDEAHAELLWKAVDPLDLPVIEQARS